MSESSRLFNSSSGGSPLLSETPFFPSGSSLSSLTGPGGDDLSISELSLSDKPATGEIDHDPSVNEVDEPERAIKDAGRLRDEKLQNDAFVLKRLNAALKSFSDALDDVGSQNERVAAQLDQTEALLNKYVDILSESEEFARLIFDEQWHGGDADEKTIAQEQREAEETARKLEAERAVAQQREQERLRREELERADQKEREQMERDRNERAAARGGVRGVRGTRASMRAQHARGGVPSSTRSSTTTTASATRGSSTTRGLGRRP